MKKEAEAQLLAEKLRMEKLQLEVRLLQIKVQNMEKLLSGQIDSTTRFMQDFNTHINRYAENSCNTTAKQTSLLIAVRSLINCAPYPEEVQKSMELFATMMQASSAISGYAGGSIPDESRIWLDWLCDKTHDAQ